MSALATDRVAWVVAAAQRVLAKRLGAPVRLVEPEELGGSGRTVVLRVRVAENFYYLPRTLIVKQVQKARRGEWDTEPGVTSADAAFVREAVSYQFATAMPREDRPGPDLLAHDLTERLLILSDLGSGLRLGAQLRRPGSSPENLVVALAQALGRMHAATVGRESDFDALLRRADVTRRPDAVGAQAATAVDAVPVMLRDKLGVDVPAGARKAALAGSQLFARGPCRAFSPADLCPDNVIVNDDGVRFLDYEWGGFRDATLDITYLLTMFPACLCYIEIPTEREQSLIDAWRAEIVGVWPVLADDDALDRRLLDATVIWVWLTTYWFMPDNEIRFAAARQHGSSIPRSKALVVRWQALERRARAARRGDIADFAAAVVTELTTRRWS